MTIKVSIEVPELQERKLSECSLHAHDRLEEVSLTPDNPYQQNKHSTTTPAKVQNESLTQGVEKEVTLSYVSKEKNRDKNNSELKLSSFSIFKMDGFVHTNSVVEVKKDYVSNKQNTDNLPPAVLNMECNESKIVDGHTNSYTMNEPATPTPFYVYGNANEMFDEDACSCILNEQNTDNLPPAILTPSNLDGNVNEILDKDTSIYTTNEQNINNLATLTPFNVDSNASEVLDDDCFIMNKRKTDFLPASMTPFNVNGIPSEMFDEDTDSYIANERHTDNMPLATRSWLNVDDNASKMLDEDSGMYSRSIFSALGDNKEALNNENLLLPHCDKYQTMYMQEDNTLFFDGSMQDSGDCLIPHDQTVHVQEDETILFLVDSVQDSGDYSYHST